MIKEYDDIEDDKIFYSCFLCHEQRNVMLQIIKQTEHQKIDNIKLGGSKEMFLCFRCLIDKILKDKVSDIV